MSDLRVLKGTDYCRLSLFLFAQYVFILRQTTIHWRAHFSAAHLRNHATTNRLAASHRIREPIPQLSQDVRNMWSGAQGTLHDSPSRLLPRVARLIEQSVKVGRRFSYLAAQIEPER